MKLANSGVLALLILASACNRSPSSANEGKDVADQLTGDAGQQAADNPQCKLFKPDELEVYSGKPLRAPRNAAGGTGCQWEASDEDGYVQIQLVQAKDSNPPTGAEGYREIDGGGYVAPGMTGWDAGATQGDKAVIVSIGTATAKPESAIALLKETMKRSAP